MKKVVGATGLVVTNKYALLARVDRKEYAPSAVRIVKFDPEHSSIRRTRVLVSELRPFMDKETLIPMVRFAISECTGNEPYIFSKSGAVRMCVRKLGKQEASKAMIEAFNRVVVSQSVSSSIFPENLSESVKQQIPWAWGMAVAAMRTENIRELQDDPATYEGLRSEARKSKRVSRVVKSLTTNESGDEVEVDADQLSGVLGSEVDQYVRRKIGSLCAFPGESPGEKELLSM